MRPPPHPPIAGWRTQEGIVPLAQWTALWLLGHRVILCIPPSEEPPDHA